jgi:hypothetical protein
MPRVRYVGTPSPLFDNPERTHLMIVAGRQARKEGRVPDPRRGELTEAHVWEAERRRLGGPRRDRGHPEPDREDARALRRIVEDGTVGTSTC